MRRKYNGRACACPPIFVHNTLNSYDLMKETEIGFHNYDSDELIFWPTHGVAALGSVRTRTLKPLNGATMSWFLTTVPDNVSWFLTA